jgi:hypothetical protein
MQQNHHARLAAAIGLFFSVVTSVAALAYPGDATIADPARRIKGQTIVSEKFPKAELRVQKGFHFIGTQKVNLYGNADAEQFLFASWGPNHVVERFYWLQFEQFLPTNKLTYNYNLPRKAQIGDLEFVCDAKSMSDLAVRINDDPASDAAAIGRLLAKKHLSFPHKAVYVRMFHLPSADHRTELMIIYGEALPPESAVPVGKDIVNLDVDAPASAQMFAEHARQGLTIQTR